MSGWEKEKILKFIKEFEKRDVLWNKNHKFYFNIAKKEDAWREIGKVMNETVDVLKKKMDSLRGSRRREKSRMLKTAATGRGRKNMYISKWFAWESMLFLEDPDETRPTLANLSSTENEEHDEDSPGSPLNQNDDDNSDVSNSEEQWNCRSQQMAEERNIDGNVIITRKKKPEPKKFKSSKKVPPRRRSEEDTRLDVGHDIFKNTLQGEKKDESALFGEYIAEKLRKMDNKQRVVTQHKIHGLVLEAEIATFSPHSPSRLLPSSPHSPPLQSLLDPSTYNSSPL